MIVITSVNLSALCFLLSLNVCVWLCHFPAKTRQQLWVDLEPCYQAVNYTFRKSFCGRLRKQKKNEESKWGGQQGSTDWESRTQEAPACAEGWAFIWPRSHQVVSLFTLSPCSSLWPGHYWLPWATPFSTTFIDLKRARHFPFSLFPPEWLYGGGLYPSPHWSSLANRGTGLINYKLKALLDLSPLSSQHKQGSLDCLGGLLSFSSSCLYLGSVKTSRLIN